MSSLGTGTTESMAAEMLHEHPTRCSDGNQVGAPVHGAWGSCMESESSSVNSLSIHVCSDWVLMHKIWLPSTDYLGAHA